MKKIQAMLAITVMAGVMLSLSSCETCKDGHAETMKVYSNIVEPTCTEEGSKTETVHCAICYEEISSKKVSVEPTGHLLEDGRCLICGEADPAFNLSIKINADGTGYEILSVGGFNESILVIPEEYSGKNIVAIADGAFENCAFLKTVVLPTHMTSIGAGAFKNCTSLA